MRMVITVMVLAPRGFLMGMPFPLGIRVLDQALSGSYSLGLWHQRRRIGDKFRGQHLFAMGGGFTAVFIAAGIFYLMGWLSFRKLM